jgi:hypothetical protein
MLLSSVEVEGTMYVAAIPIESYCSQWHTSLFDIIIDSFRLFMNPRRVKLERKYNLVKKHAVLIINLRSLTLLKMVWKRNLLGTSMELKTT